MRKKFAKGTVIRYSTPWESKAYVGLVTKKASSGYWVLWCDGTHSILQQQLMKHARSI